LLASDFPIARRRATVESARNSVLFISTSEPLAAKLQCEIARQCDVSAPGRLESVFEEIAAKWGRLDFALYSIGFARCKDLHGRLIDCSAEGFAYAMQVSVHSFLRMARLAEPLMTNGGCLLAFTFHGAEKVVPHRSSGHCSTERPSPSTPAVDVAVASDLRGSISVKAPTLFTVRSKKAERLGAARVRRVAY
jgi:NAD(P)-dependent dehydrogenase (short-subunit alcohol dehydrogenase family)